MKKVFSALSAALVGTSALFFSPSARADVGDTLTLRLEPGVAIPLASPQSDRFKVGAELAVKPMVSLTPWLDVGPGFSFLWLPSAVAGTDDGTAWGLGVTARVKRPRDASNKDKGLKAVSPWVDGDAQYIRTGPLDRAAFSVGVGAQVPTSDARTLWVGPFVRYQDIVQSLSTRPGYDRADAYVLIAGLSFEFGATSKKKEEKVVAVPAPCPEPVKPVDPPAAPAPKPPPPPPPVERKPVELRQLVPFRVDSALLEPASRTLLDEALRKLLDNRSYHVQIDGHASSEGPPEPYNTNLSVRRAQAVFDYLKSHGVPAANMSVKGFGATRPVASNDTEAGRVRNRRVEVEVKFEFTNVSDGATK